MEEKSEFVTLIDHEEYEILTTYPHTIRRKDNHNVVNEYNNQGYIFVTFNRKSYFKHRLIALQFIPNPNNLPFIDHINHIRNDNRIMNLRWVSYADNQFNKSSGNKIQYEFIDNIPDNAIKILFYETRTERHEFEEDKYYFYHDNETDEDKFYLKITNTLYRIMYINTVKCGKKMIHMKDINHKRVGLYIEVFKHQHSLD